MLYADGESKLAHHLVSLGLDLYTAQTREDHLHSMKLRQIKAALVDQAFLRSVWVSCAIGVVVAVRRRKGQLLAMIRGWGVRWYPVECVLIEYAGCQLRS
jgi:hypothetical protein